MKIFIIVAALVLIATPLTVTAQSGAKQQPQIQRDAELEKDSLHNLEVARHYFKTRKAYVAALQRSEEIIAANPAFSRIDEALFMAGQSSLNLARRQGKTEVVAVRDTRGRDEEDADCRTVSRVSSRFLHSARQQLSRKQFSRPGRRCASHARWKDSEQ